MLTEDQKKDLEDKNNMLINVLNLKDEKDLNVANAMLLKGRGYRTEDLADGRIQQIIGDNEDFHYRCEIGKMIDIYINPDFNFDLSQPYILDIAKKLSKKQFVNCSVNIKDRLSFAMNMIESDDKNEISQKTRDLVINQMNKCEEVLLCERNN